MKRRKAEKLMRITNLHIENFRSIQDLTLCPSQITALVGPNNAGKSNILLAIQKVIGRDWLSVGQFDESDVYGLDNNRDVTIELSFDPALEYLKFVKANPVRIRTLNFTYTRYKIGEKAGQRRLEQKCFDANGRPPMVPVKAPQKDGENKLQPLVNIPQEVRESIPLIYIGTNRSLQNHLPSARYSLLRQLFEDINRDFHDPSHIVKVKQADGKTKDIPKSEWFNTLMTKIMNLLRTDAFVKLETDIKCNALQQLGFDPDVDTDKLDFFFSPFDTMDFYKTLELKVREHGYEINATELGEGFQNAIVLSILQAFEENKKKGAILLIEEPEMFLHPQMQRTLYKTLRKIGETNQIIYTTHSPQFVTVPEYNDILVIRKDEEGTHAVPSSLPTNAKRKEKLIKELDPERNEMFFATRLLLVEGDTEKLALPEYAKRLGIDLDRKGSSIVEVGGKRNLPEFADIASSFGIPTGILYDIDSSEIQDTDEEEEFNEALNERETDDGSVKVWCFKNKYEDSLKKALGEKAYQGLCQKYPKIGKPTRARLIAMEEGLSIPKPIEEILNWLVDIELIDIDDD